MMEERAAAAVASAASCRPLGSGTAPNPTAAAPASSPAPGPGPVGKGGGGGGSPGPTAGPEPLSLPGILHFIRRRSTLRSREGPLGGRARRAAGSGGFPPGREERPRESKDGPGAADQDAGVCTEAREGQIS
ncbi:striatin, calmodulin binding protein 4 (predicted), isoform CRA_b [Rattus norvegicus]|uniref:Striatin, calmodulin binding protein 4 (Predicted), isoform CRA_b n=1 Tax=Rattus norvegicus TaxID=10116 RepID=A6J8C9_RAT|nr:striatin, calmodulin binding protein 4 (predicted), isoform CRA_b [Rattus norvegicus]